MPHERPEPVIAVVGSLNIDLVAYTRRVPGPGETVIGDRFVMGFGGKGANQAVMAARLGARVSFVGCVGDDALGAETVANLTANGVDTTGIRVVAETATGVAPIWVDERGANRILIAPGANNALDATHVRSALDALVRPPDVVVAQLETPQSATAAAFA
ncbi:MAG TPA: PfkB family carbohydrate kinase, partial [Candidatus Limnocylindrales bacterium]